MEDMIRVADVAAFNGELDTCDALIASLKRSGYVEPMRRREFAVFKSLANSLSYGNYPQFRKLLDSMLTLQAQFQEVGGEPVSKWLGLHARILLHQTMSLLFSCISGNDKIVDGILCDNIIMKTAFDHEDFIESVDEIFAESVGKDAYGTRIFEKEKKRLMDLIVTKERKTGKGRTETVSVMDTEAIADLFYDFPLSTLISEAIAFIARVEATVLPPPDMGLRSAPSSVIKALRPQSDWSEARRESSGPYASPRPVVVKVQPQAAVTLPTPAVARVVASGTKQQTLLSPVHSEPSPSPIAAKPAHNARVVTKAETVGTGSEASELHRQASEFTRKNNSRDPLNAILERAASPDGRASKRNAGDTSLDGGLGDISPITSDSDAKKRHHKVDVDNGDRNKGQRRRLNSPSRVGKKIPFDTQEEEEDQHEYNHTAAEYEPMQHASNSRVISQIHESLKTTTTKKNTLPRSLTPPRQNVQVTEDNVYTTGGAGRGAQKSERIRWSMEEEELFIAAYRKHGKAWAIILSDPEFQLLHDNGRTNVNLKDKHRNLLKYKKIDE